MVVEIAVHQEQVVAAVVPAKLDLMMLIPQHSEMVVTD
jgi:hypothetical protein